MRTMIIGAGAVGIYYGAKLAAAGQPVVFVARNDDDLDALRQRGVRVKNAKGTIAAGDVEAVIDPAQAGRCDVVLVTVKSVATQGAAYLLRPVVAPDTVVVSLQSGIENDAVLDATLRRPPLLRGVADLIADLVEPGVVHHHRGGEMIFGELDGRRGTRAERLAERLSAGGIAHRRSGAIMIEKWMKLAWDAAFNPLSALSGCTIGEMVRHRRYREQLVAAMREVVEVANASGVPVNRAYVAAAIEKSAEKLAAVRPPMLQDRIRGRTLESDALNGAVVRAANRVGVPVPVNAMLHRLLHVPPRFTRYINPGSFIGS
jgi:2-dehydropantoate 2-reductase